MCLPSVPLSLNANTVHVTGPLSSPPHFLETDVMSSGQNVMKLSLELTVILELQSLRNQTDC